MEELPLDIAVMVLEDFQEWRLGNVEEFTQTPEIIYVHQLQNLYFALTGEELTFKSE